MTWCTCPHILSSYLTGKRVYKYTAVPSNFTYMQKGWILVQLIPNKVHNRRALFGKGLQLLFFLCKLLMQAISGICTRTTPTMLTLTGLFWLLTTFLWGHAGVLTSVYWPFFTYLPPATDMFHEVYASVCASTLLLFANHWKPMAFKRMAFN